jgi:hypothetical protein
MGIVIEVDWQAERLKRQQAKAAPVDPVEGETSTQSAMLTLANLYLSQEENTELMAALNDYTCYTEAVPHIQLLVDIYQILGVQ